MGFTMKEKRALTREYAQTAEKTTLIMVDGKAVNLKADASKQRRVAKGSRSNGNNSLPLLPLRIFSQG